MIQFSAHIAHMENPKVERDRIAKEVQRIYNDLLSNMFIPAKVFYSELMTEPSHFAEEAQQVLETIKNIKKKIQQASGEIGTSKYSGVFEKEYKAHRKRAWFWLVISTILILIILYVIWLMFQVIQGYIDKQTIIETTFAVQLFFTKVLAITVLSTVLFNCIKNYNNNKHLQTIYKIRENGLKTFTLFLADEENDVTRKAIWILATNAIFEFGDTGYLSKKHISSPNSDIFRILKELG